MEIQAANPSAKVRQSNRPDKRIELTMHLQYFALVERRFCSKHNWIDLEKTANMNWLLFSLSIATSADAFLHIGNVWAHDQISALRRNTRKKETSHESTCIRPKFPECPISWLLFIVSLYFIVHGLGMQTVFLWIRNVLYNEFATSTSKL